MTFSSTNLPQPDRWIDFEANVSELFKVILDDPSTQLNGRPGQAQNGVDVFGRRDHLGWVGVQCKHKKNGVDVTEAELRTEVENAKEFRPKLSEFILITNSPRDAKIQQVAREITDELFGTEFGFSVAVWGWDDICEQVNKYPDVRKLFEPEYTPQFDGMKSEIQRLTSSHDYMRVEFSTLKDGKDTTFIGKIKAYCEINEQGDANKALVNLLKLKCEQWDKVKDYEKCQLLLALSSSYIKTGTYLTAGDLIKQVFAEFPDHVEGHSNLALAHYLHKEYEQAMAIAEGVISEYSDNVHAVIILIQSRIKLEYENELHEIPNELLRNEVVIAAQITGLRECGDEVWKELAITAYREFDKIIDVPELKLICAEAILEYCLRAENNENKIDESKYIVFDSDLDYAVEVTSSLALIALSNNSYRAPYLVHNAVIAYQLQNNYTDARDLVRSARVLYPSENNLRVLAVELAHFCSDFPEVLYLTDNDHLHSSEAVMRAAVLIELARIEEAVGCFSQIEMASAPIHIHLQVIELKAQLAMQETEFYSIDDFYEDVKDSEASVNQKLAIRSMEARFRRILGQTESARDIVENLSSKITPENHWLDRKCVAMEAMHHGLYDHVVKSMTNYVSMERDSTELRMLLKAILLSGDEFGVGTHLDALPEKIKNSRYFHRMKVTLASHTGDPSAIDKLTEYISQYPNDTVVLLELFRRYRLSASVDEAVELTKSIALNAQEGSVIECMELTTQISKFGRFRESFEAAHQLLMNNWDNPEIHRIFTLMMLMPEQDLSQILSDCSLVGFGTAIELSVNGEMYTYRLEDDETHSLFLDERLTSGSELMPYLIGKAYLEKFEIGHGINKRIYRVENIKPIYVDSLRRSMAEIKARFPTYNVVSMMTVNPDKEGGFQAITEMLESQNVANTKAVELYRDEDVPVSILAARMGIGVLDFYAMLRNKGISHVNYKGTTLERKKSLRAILENGKAGCVVDVHAIELINLLDIGDFVELEIGKIYLSQIVVDYLSLRLIQKKEFVKKGAGKLHLYNGAPLAVDNDVQAMEVEIQQMEKDLNWVQEHCQVVAVTRDSSVPAELTQLEAELKTPIFDSALISKSENVLFLSDDYYLRTVVSSRLGVKSCWIQILLELIYRNGHLTLDQYLEKVILIARTGASFLPISSMMLTRKAEADGHTVSNEFILLLSYLGVADARLESGIDVATEFLSSLYRSDIQLNCILRYLSAVLCVLCKHRWNTRYNVVLETVRALSDDNYLPIQPISTHAKAWLVGHSMGSK